MELEQNNILVWLSHIEGITHKDIKQLIEYFDNIEEIWKAKEEHITGALVDKIQTANKIIGSRKQDLISKIFETLNDNKILALTIYDDAYPAKLKAIYDPPFTLFIKGGKIDFDKPLIAIVGSRKATPYGKWAAYQFAKDLTSWDVGIISGLALGVDASAHKGALENGGYTIGVLGCGLDQYYPASNRAIMDKMISKGCIISEYPLGTLPLKYHFPARNRIVSALSDGVAVIEASDKSGALITVDFALDHGKDIYALPGNINNTQSRGTNKLIKDGAKILLSPDDIIENLKYKYTINKIDTEESIKEDLSELETKIFNIIKRRPVNIDLIISEMGIKASDISPILTILEIKGYISQMPGKIFTASK